MRGDREQRELEKRRKTETAQLVVGFSRGAAYDVGLVVGAGMEECWTGLGQGMVLPVMGSRHVRGIVTND